MYLLIFEKQWNIKNTISIKNIESNRRGLDEDIKRFI